MSTHESESNKSVVPTNNQLEAEINDLESQLELVRGKIDDIDPTGPNGELREVRRQVQANSKAIKSLRRDIQELHQLYEETAEACRNANGLRQDVLVLQGQVAELEAGGDG